jgi:tRNA A22 N-methylase
MSLPDCDNLNFIQYGIDATTVMNYTTISCTRRALVLKKHNKKIMMMIAPALINTLLLYSLSILSKTRQRLGPLVSLARATNATTVADIGCDHGLLALELAPYFDRVMGIDASVKALEQGALSLAKEEVPENVEFVLGYGLEPLLDTKMELIILAGVGVHTIMEILTSSSVLDALEIQWILIQPTNSRPRHLQKLYRRLNEMEFYAKQEHVAFVSNRWYVSTLFEKQQQDDSFTPLSLSYPGGSLMYTADPIQKRIYRNYVDHHVAWLEQDLKLQGGRLLDSYDQHWLTAHRNQ